MFLRLNCKFIFLFFLFFGTAPKVFSSSCCNGSGGQSICILPAEQKYQLGMSTSYRKTEGHFDPYADYTANPTGISSNTMSTVLGGAYRLNEDWQIGVSIPFIRNNQNFSNQPHSATAMGDPAIEGRYMLWEDLAFLTYRPQFVLYGGARLPFGTSIYNSTDPYQVNAVGDGTTTFHIGATVSKLYRPVKLTFDMAYFYPLSKHVDQMHGQTVAPYDLKTGNRIQSVQSIAYLLNEHWSTSLGTKQMWQMESSVNSDPVSGSAGRLFSSLASVAYSHNDHWSFSANYETGFPFYKYQANQANTQAISLAGTYGGF